MSRMGVRALAPLRVPQASYQEEARNHGTQADRLRSTGALAWLSARRITDGGAGVTQRKRRFGAIRTALGQSARSRSQRITHFWPSWDCVATDVAQLSQMLAFQTLSAVMAEATYQSGYNPPSWHCLGPGNMPLKAKRCRHVAVAIPIVSVGGLVTARPRQ
jgi:hypothetical protein